MHKLSQDHQNHPNILNSAILAPSTSPYANAMPMCRCYRKHNLKHILPNILIYHPNPGQSHLGSCLHNSISEASKRIIQPASVWTLCHIHVMLKQNEIHICRPSALAISCFAGKDNTTVGVCVERNEGCCFLVTWRDFTSIFTCEYISSVVQWNNVSCVTLHRSILGGLMRHCLYNVIPSANVRTIYRAKGVFVSRRVELH